jgi:hypothetical protein
MQNNYNSSPSREVISVYAVDDKDLGLIARSEDVHMTHITCYGSSDD